MYMQNVFSVIYLKTHDNRFFININETADIKIKNSACDIKRTDNEF